MLQRANYTDRMKEQISRQAPDFTGTGRLQRYAEQNADMVMDSIANLLMRRVTRARPQNAEAMEKWANRTLPHCFTFSDDLVAMFQ